MFPFDEYMLNGDDPESYEELKKWQEEDTINYLRSINQEAIKLINDYLKDNVIYVRGDWIEKSGYGKTLDPIEHKVQFSELDDIKRCIWDKATTVLEKERKDLEIKYKEAFLEKKGFTGFTYPLMGNLNAALDDFLCKAETKNPYALIVIRSLIELRGEYANRYYHVWHIPMKDNDELRELKLTTPERVDIGLEYMLRKLVNLVRAMSLLATRSETEKAIEQSREQGIQAERDRIKRERQKGGRNRKLNQNSPQIQEARFFLQSLEEESKIADFKKLPLNEQTNRYVSWRMTNGYKASSDSRTYRNHLTLALEIYQNETLEKLRP